jgi:cytidyltransferase-like protein
VIVSTKELGSLRRKVAMVDGGFDPLHPGHVLHFREAHGLGVPLLCNITSDDYVSRKHPPLLSQAERGEIIDAIRYVDFTHLASTTTADVLQLLQPRYYVKGADWRGRLPEAELEICADNKIEVVYLDTVLSSSTSLLERYEERWRRRGG